MDLDGILNFVDFSVGALDDLVVGAFDDFVLMHGVLALKLPGHVLGPYYNASGSNCEVIIVNLLTERRWLTWYIL